jgi:hypothetical protein
MVEYSLQVRRDTSMFFETRPLLKACSRRMRVFELGSCSERSIRCSEMSFISFRNDWIGLKSPLRPFAMINEKNRELAVSKEAAWR